MKPAIRVIPFFSLTLMTLLLTASAYAGHNTLCLTAPNDSTDEHGCALGSSIGNSETFQLSEHGEHADKAKINLSHWNSHYRCTRTVKYKEKDNKYEKLNTERCSRIPKGLHAGSISIFIHGKWHFRQTVMFENK